MKNKIGISFVGLGLAALLAGILLGCLSALQFIIPGFADSLSFVKSRPLHVSLVVSWIFLSAIGGIYYYLPKFCNLKLHSPGMARVHFWIFLITGICILGSYVAGKFGGREYWEYPPVLSIPIFITWLMFGFNYFKTVAKLIGQWPIYIWMWGTGILFFFLTFSESYLWLIPYFRDHLPRDLTVQWKSYGALVGSWNMLVYGTAFFVMERISGDQTIARSRLSFLMFFLGFTNLLFGWAHHIYIVPSAQYIQYIAYVISMTELIILARIIWNWKMSITASAKLMHVLSFRFLFASDIWILINLMLAIAISIPAVNVFTHGTHITVAHAMGSTIGINTMILIASCIFLVTDATQHRFSMREINLIKSGFWITNGSLMLFFSALIFAGAEKGRMILDGHLNFSEIMNEISPFLISFVVSGFGILIGLTLVVVPVLLIILRNLKRNSTA